MKEYMRALSYQRVPDNEKILALDYNYQSLQGPIPYRIPDIINVAYNGAFGSQNGMFRHDCPAPNALLTMCSSSATGCQLPAAKHGTDPSPGFCSAEA